LIDADVLVYEAAFAAQHTTYHMYNTLVGRVSFDSAAECQGYCEREGIAYRASRKAGVITTELEYLPEAACKNIFLSKLSSILENTGAKQYTLLLSGEGNYREEVAVTKPYKGTRVADKPIHYEYCHSMINAHRNTVQTIGVEADDALGIMQCEAIPDTTVICSVDKDLNMIPGLHYDWGKGIKYRVSPIDAFYWLCYQLLVGDSTDNIPGVPRMGDKKANDVLSPLRKDAAAMWGAVIEQYSGAPFKTNWGDLTSGPVEYLTEQLQLLWIQRAPEQRMTPSLISKGVADGSIAGSC
jgi:hypothetical protein